MWIFKYLICVVRKHNFATITKKELSYLYCLRCGRLEILKAENLERADNVQSSTGKN